MWSYYSAKPLIIRFNNVPLFAEMLFLTTCQYMLLLNLNIENVIISGYYSQKSGDSCRLLEICRFQLYFWYFLRANITPTFSMSSWNYSAVYCSKSSFNLSRTISHAISFADEDGCLQNVHFEIGVSKPRSIWYMVSVFCSSQIIDA